MCNTSMHTVNDLSNYVVNIKKKLTGQYQKGNPYRGKLIIVVSFLYRKLF